MLQNANFTVTVPAEWSLAIGQVSAANTVPKYVTPRPRVYSPFDELINVTAQLLGQFSHRPGVNAPLVRSRLLRAKQLAIQCERQLGTRSPYFHNRLASSWLLVANGRFPTARVEMRELLMKLKSLRRKAR